MRSAHRLAALATALWLAGCAGDSGTGTPSGWMDRMVGNPVAEGEPRVAYVAAARAKVYREPNAEAPVVGVLARDEAVSRYQHEYGFAYVLAEGNVAGWVRESELAEKRVTARKPSKPKPPATPAPAAEPTPAPPETTVTETPVEGETPVEEEPALDEEAPEPERSVFDPY